MRTLELAAELAELLEAQRASPERERAARIRTLNATIAFLKERDEDDEHVLTSRFTFTLSVAHWFAVFARLAGERLTIEGLALVLEAGAEMSAQLQEHVTDLPTKERKAS